MDTSRHSNGLPRIHRLSGPNEEWRQLREHSPDPQRIAEIEEAKRRQREEESRIRAEEARRREEEAKRKQP